MSTSNVTLRNRNVSHQRHYFDLLNSRGKVLDIAITPTVIVGEPPDSWDEITRAIFRERETSPELDILIAEKKNATSFLLQSMKTSTESGTNGLIGIKLVFPSSEGYISRVDFFKERMVHCPWVKSVGSFVTPLRLVKPTSGMEENFLNLIATSTSAISVQASTSDLLVEKMESLNEELYNRISLPWHFPNKIIKKRLALIQGGYNLDFRIRILETCLALGIELYVLDKPGHWLQDPSFSHVCKAFLPVDLTLDDGLVQRIVETLSTNHVKMDGVTCFSDTYLVATAKVASILELQTSPAMAFSRVVDKYECRKFLGGGDEAVRCSDLNELTQHLDSESCVFQYPLIVKPTKGSGSRGVYKVNNEAELRLAGEAVVEKNRGPFLIEEYVDGPEIDANYVMLNDEIIFFEVSDNLPCAADKQGAHTTDSFLETGMIFPSGLEQTEIELIRSSIHEDLLRLGFHTGVFHTEARLRHSSIRYDIGEDGTVDIHRRSDLEAVNTNVFIIEINARAPGRQATNGVAQIYGVDYNAIQLLFAVGETERAVALAKPFENGSQFWCESVYIPAPRGGVYNSDDAFLELVSRRPDLAEHIAENHSLFEKGQIVLGPESGALEWILSFLVFSRSSRSHALKLADVIRGELRYDLV